jgi:CRP/FNR family transcriptional regulator, cyclic AMP receptor protein
MGTETCVPDGPTERTRSFWDALNEPERETLLEAGRERDFHPNDEPLCFEGDASSTNVLIILSGWAKVTSPTPSGRQVVFAVRGPGDLVGEVSALFSRPRTATVEALDAIRALTVPASRFTTLLDDHPRWWWPLTATIAGRVDELSNRLRWHAEADGKRRLAHLLVYLAELSLRYQKPGSAGIEILPRLSHTELGSWVDASRETAARGFHELRGRGLVATGWKRVTVLDLQGMRDYADGVDTP